MKNVKDLKEKEVIHCKNDEECHEIAKLLNNAGFKRQGGGSYLDKKAPHNFHFKDCFCFNVNSGCYADLHFYQKEYNYTIHEAKDFLPTKETTDPTKQVLQEIIKDWHDLNMQKSLINLIREKL